MHDYCIMAWQYDTYVMYMYADQKLANETIRVSHCINRHVFQLSLGSSAR
jgi:hypothetical protein